MPSIKDLIELMTASWPVVTAAFLASLAVLVAYHLELSYLDSLPAFVPGASFLLSILSGSILLVSALQAIVKIVMKPVWRRRLETVRQRDIELLNELPEFEAALLAWAAANNTQVFSAPYFNPYTKALVAKGLLSIPGGHHHTDDTPFHIPDHIWKAIRADMKGAPADLTAQLQGLRPFG